MTKKEYQRGQTTLFIIVAVVIIASVILLFYLTPLKEVFRPSEPELRLQDCIGGKLKEVSSLVLGQGGSVEPILYLNYQSKKIEYLCYTNQYYKTCVMQQPLLKQHIEKEIYNYVREKTKKCFQDLKGYLRKKGYSVREGKEEISVSIEPKNVKIIISGFSVTKEEAKSYEEFELRYKSEMYNLIMLASNILNWEARYGDSDIKSYMLYYPNIKVEKYKQEDGSKIYKLTSRSSGESFIFATRSLSWPPGYGIGKTHKLI